MNLDVELEQETDGRWIAEVPDLPGVLAYGHSRETALAHAQALAVRVLAEWAREARERIPPIARPGGPIRILLP